MTGIGGTIAPVIVTEAGAQLTPPDVIRQQLVSLVAATNPGFTGSLPASLIEDLVSTMVAGLSAMNQAQVETINSLTPFLANPFILTQLGNLLGVPLSLATNTGVDVVFSATVNGQPQPGVVIAKGFTVSDGSHQYIVQDGGVTTSSGSTIPLFCLASVAGSWPVPAATVTQTVTSDPPGVALSVTNPIAGTPATGAETQASYAARVFQALLAASQGMSRYLKTLLENVAGVQPRLVSVRQQVGGGWEVICGGGDPYQVAYAIYTALFDISTLVGSAISVTSVSKAARAVYTTDLTHGLVDGEVVTVASANPALYDVTGTAATAHVLSATAFSLNVNSSAYTASYVGSGVVSPNSRNIGVSLLDYPDTYVIPFVNPPQQTVSMVATWNTTSINFVSSAAVSQLASPALAAYVNSLATGEPMNLFVLESTFQAAVSSVLPVSLLTTLEFAVSIDGVGVAPIPGTGIISGDPESYFFTEESGSQIVVVQG